ncbi:MAG: HAD family phosphatase [Ruminococcaceae bacterium]|nr:HAD family phosphatase [Oscillospiraceae bacterium]
MEKRAIFLDFDGTLSLENKVSEENCKVLKLVQDLGHYVFISTGRNHQGIEPIASKFHSFDGYISGLGSRITFGEDVIFENFFPFDTVEKAVRMFLDTGFPGIITSVDCGYAVNPLEDYRMYFTEIPSVEYLYENCKNSKFQKIESRKTTWTPEQMEFWEEIGTTFVHEGYTECCPHGCSKSKAIEIVANKLGIKPENTIAMGDSANDIDMLDAAGIGVVMGNAPNFMKEKADFITKSCRDNGVAYALSQLILNKA